MLSSIVILIAKCPLNLRAGREDVLQAIDDPDCSILDHRSREEYLAERIGLPGKPDVGAERYGRIPGAVHVPLDSLLNGDTTFRAVDEIREIIGASVDGADSPVISYCRLAHRATLASFAMTEKSANSTFDRARRSRFHTRVADGSELRKPELGQGSA